MDLVLIVVLLVALIAAFWLRQTGRAAQIQTGVPLDVRIVYSDTGAWERVEKPLFSRRYRLTGKPDYIVEDENGARIPIEVKPNRTSAQPRLSDVMQLMAYGVLIQEQFGMRPEFGLLKYRDQLFHIPFTDDLRSEFFEILRDLRAARNLPDVPRNHDDPARCRYCGYRDACDQRLE